MPFVFRSLSKIGRPGRRKRLTILFLHEEHIARVNSTALVYIGDEHIHPCAQIIEHCAGGILYAVESDDEMLRIRHTGEVHRNLVLAAGPMAVVAPAVVAMSSRFPQQSRSYQGYR